jgi:predicted acetyltransferase
MTLRPRERWLRAIRSLPEENGQAYLILKEEKPIGYFFCEHIPAQPRGQECITRDFACATQEAYRAMFGFLAALPTNVVKITVSAPILPLLAEFYKEPFLTMKWALPFQYRVLDVERAIAARGYVPEAKGKIAMKIQDECGDWNTGTWEIEVQEGKGKAKRSSSSKPELEMTIQEFSGLYMGALDAERSAAHGLFGNISPKTIKKMNALFYDHPVHLLDAF